MKSEHAQPEAFRKMIAGEASPAEAKAIVRHLLAGCGRCIQRSQAAKKEVEAQEWTYELAFANLERLLDGDALEHQEQPVRRVAYGGMRH